MPEEEPFSANRWNQRVNVFLSALGWRQIGDSNVDVACGVCNQKHGLDSVFVYELPSQVPQLVLVDAKEYGWKNAHAAEIEKWCRTLSDKLEHVPYSSDFARKFAVPPGTSYDTGLIVLWVKDETDFSSDQLALRLKAINLPQYRKNPKRIFVLANQQVLFLCTIVEELRRLRGMADSFRNVRFYLPSYGRFNSASVDTLPLEYMYSKVIFATAELRSDVGSITSWHPIDIVFYTGAVDYDSLAFLGLALRRFEIGVKQRDLHLYFTRPTDNERSSVAQFQRDLKPKLSRDLKIEQLTPGITLPGWLSHED